MRRVWIGIIMLLCLSSSIGMAEQTAQGTGVKQKKLAVVGTAHLDTQWRWTIQTSINEYIPLTFTENEKLFKLFPNYVFSFEGAFRYQVLKEYYPEYYERLKKYIADGRWRVTGSWVDAVDVNMPSFESLVRQTLYGNGYWKREFGKVSRDVFLPDCFGFGYALPSIERHCGLESFSTQKLSWGSAHGLPFNIGVWTGVDGSSVIAGLNPRSYGSQIRHDLRTDTTWLKDIKKQEDTSGLPLAYMYFGTGDTGGSPDSTSVFWLEQSMRNAGDVKVLSVGADDLVDLVKEGDTSKLPHYRGELVMTRHGSGCYTSQSAMKRWNRQNELLADAAERASVIAWLVANQPYPREELRDTWTRFLWHQFHDDLTGTSIPEAYVFSWNDELLCQNRFSQILTKAVAATSPYLDTRAKGVPLIVYNPLGIDRQDVVDAVVQFKAPAPKFIRVFGPDKKEIPSQVVTAWDDSLKILFLAKAPSVGYAVYDVQPSPAASSIKSTLAVTNSSLENESYKVQLNANGDVSSIFDKTQNKELLSAPIEYQMLTDKPKAWPAWEIWYDDIMAKPRAIVGGIPEIKIIENGPVRVTLEVNRVSDKSKFSTLISLAAGDAGKQVEFDNTVDWYERETLLKAAFTFAEGSDSVTYDLGLGAIKRGVNYDKLYEVPAHQWADMGTAVFSDCKYGWDHPDKNTLRLTLIHTPGVYENWSWVEDEKSMDNGHHEFGFALHGHTGDFGPSTVYGAARFNEPLLAFQTAPHKGDLGKNYSLLTANAVAGSASSDVRLKAAAGSYAFVNSVKLAEDDDRMVVRVRNILPAPIFLNLKLTPKISTSSEVDGAEKKLGEMSTEFRPYQPKAFAFELQPVLQGHVDDAQFSRTLDLPYNLDGISDDDSKKDGNFDTHGNSLAGEQLLPKMEHLRIPFVTGPRTPGAANVVACKGQKLTLPAGTFNKINFLVASVDGPAQATFTIGDTLSRTRWILDWSSPLGQWNSRVANGRFADEPEQIAPEFIHRDPVAWYASHRHTADGKNEAYRFTYLFLLSFDLPAGVKTVTLPSNDRVRVVAATATKFSDDPVRPAQPLYDVADAAIAAIAADSVSFAGKAKYTLTTSTPGAIVHYTLDGKTPTEVSPVYQSPITVTGSSLLKARAIKPGINDSYVNELYVTKLSPRKARIVDKLLPGLVARYYEGAWEKLPDFGTLKPLRDTLAGQVVIPPYARDENFGLTFDGFIKVPADGTYEFTLSSDDGSMLMVSDSIIVNNDGVHGSGEMPGLVVLNAGIHPIRVNMFQHEGDEALAVTISGPGLPKQTLPASMLFHQGPLSKKRGK